MGCLVAAAAALTTVSAADKPATKPSELIVTPLTGDASRIVRLINVEIPPGADSGRHHHFGDQFTTVQEGEIHIAIEGQGDKLYKAGDVAHIDPMVVHRTYNASDRPARTLEVFIVAKDKPNTVKEE
jgi:quercetin dioxygenase-like cupin family protein